MQKAWTITSTGLSTTNFLLYAINDVGISGVAMAYPLPRRFDNSLVSLLPSNEKVESEEKADLCVMDWAADDAPSRRALVLSILQKIPKLDETRQVGCPIRGGKETKQSIH